MIDGTVIADYLVAAAGGAGSRLVDRSLDQGLTALSQAVIRRLGRGPIDDLTDHPDSIRARQRVAAAIESAAEADERFERELADLRDRIDEAGGWQYITIHTGRSGRTVVGGPGNGHTAAGNISTYDFYAPQPDDLSGAPAWTKTCLWIGGAIAALGWAIMMLGIAQHTSQSTPGTGFAIFAIGGLIMGAGELGARTSRPRRHR
ncbi:hypothetical protein [Nocardia pseudobrasiliensis]|uniref:Uncharacterized protein n=1 Tax=Nocardia pseudobrasiliensis TaxID=45979 RepID=A0A370HYU3_9NOCA|nr:hypothetical protein [Nocardia pseudobrasiliensis]RDI63692.1 hypothetical protein DFR76_10927 [Nocardia pseudobrasiliensis]